MVGKRKQRKLPALQGFRMLVVFFGHVETGTFFEAAEVVGIYYVLAELQSSMWIYLCIALCICIYIYIS